MKADPQPTVEGFRCVIVEADFEASTVLLRMTGNYTVSAGPYVLAPLPQPSEGEQA